MRLSAAQYAAFLNIGKDKSKKIAVPDEKKKNRGNAVNTGGYRSNVQGYRTIGGKRHYYRSLWEIQYAQYLEWLKENEKITKWEYEPQTFSFPKDEYRAGPFTYKPDFRITELNGKQIWHEVKGYLNALSRHKIKRFRKHYKDQELILIDADWFKKARKQNLHKIVGFEELTK